MAKAKFTSTRITVGQAKKLQGFFDETDKWLTKTSNEMRDQLESGTRTSLQNFAAFFGHPRLRPKLSDEVRQAVEHYEAGSRDDSVWVSTSLLRKEFNKFVAKMKEPVNMRTIPNKPILFIFSFKINQVPNVDKATGNIHVNGRTICELPLLS